MSKTIFVAAFVLVLFGASSQAQEPARKPADDEAEIANARSARLFVSRLNKGIELIARHHYSPVDQDKMAVEAVRGLYKTLDVAIPKSLDIRLEKLSGEKKGANFEEQLNQALEDLDRLNGKGQRFDVLEEARLKLERKMRSGQDSAIAFRHVLSTFEGKANVLWPEQVTRLRLLHNGPKFGEIGIDIVRPTKEGPAIVRSTVKDGPAHRAGLRSGDTIHRYELYYDWRHVPLEEPQSFKINKLLGEVSLNRMLYGYSGDKIRLWVERDGKTFDVTMTRTPVRREALAGANRRDDNSWNFVLDEKLGIGYIRVLNFVRTEMLGEFEQALAALEEKSVKALVLDLRFAGQGWFESAVAISDLLIDEGPIVEFRGRNKDSGLRNAAKGSRLDVPIACLINGESNVGAEIIASCLQDHLRAVVIGERTAGNAAIVQYYPFEGSFMQITTAHCYRANGKPLDRSMAEIDKSIEWGVTPDAGFAVPLTAEDRETLREHLHRQTLLKEDAAASNNFRDVQLDRALAYVRTKIR